MKRKISAPESNVDGVSGSAKQKVDEKPSLYKPLTSDELKELTENENLYKSNIFRMQLSYLLDEVCLKEKRRKVLDEVLHSLNGFLSGLSKEGSSLSIKDALKTFADIKFPIPDIIRHEDVAGHLGFFAPDEINVVGSYLLQTSLKGNCCLDVVVQMPRACMQDKDYLNFRYHIKRALYLCWLAEQLKRWPHADEIKFAADQGCTSKPFLVVSLKGKLAGRCLLHVMVKMPDGFFKPQRFAMSKSNVRVKWYGDSKGNSSENPEPCTPHYNCSVLADMLVKDHLHLLYNSIKSCPGMKDAICLFKVWLQQRCYDGRSKFNGFIGSMFMVYLLKTKRISPQMTSYQIFRMALHGLVSTDWTVAGLCLADVSSETNVGMYHRWFEVVFLDQSGLLNICANVDRTTYRMITHEAKLALQILDDSSTDGFDILFMQRLSFLRSSDYYFRLVLDDELEKKLLAVCDSKEIVQYGGEWYWLTFRAMVKVLERGLGKRVRRLLLRPPPLLQWSTECEPPSRKQYVLEIGLALDEQHFDSVLERGPVGDDPMVGEFRAFWGSRSLLRRFQDGSINEAVFWKCNSTEEKKLLCRNIVLHLLETHFTINPSALIFRGTEFNSLIRPKVRKSTQARKPVPKNPSLGCGEEEAQQFILVFDQFCKQLRNLEGMPLAVRAIDGIDAAFRLTEVSPPLQYQLERTVALSACLQHGTMPSWCPSFKVLLQLEASGKWPEDVAAIARVKAAFYLKLVELLRNQCSLEARAAASFVDVFKAGYVFRISIVQPRELQLCKQLAESSSGQQAVAHEMMYVKLDTSLKKAVHSTFMKSLSGEFIGYAETARLAKCWISAHLLSNYVADEAVELIVASLFLSPAPHETPRSHFSGFIGFLAFLSTFNWQLKPLFVNLGGQLTGELRSAFEERFSTNRERFADLHIVTSYDTELSIWTKHLPRHVLVRCNALASVAVRLLEKCGDVSDDIAKQLFRPSLTDYDVVIKLKRDNRSSRKRQPGCDQPLHSSEATAESFPIVHFDPAQLYIDELQQCFGDVALFFFDKYKPEVIGVVWKASAMKSESFKILNAKFKMPAPNTAQKGLTGCVLPNVPAIMSDFKTLGDGLVDEVCLNRR